MIIYITADESSFPCFITMVLGPVAVILYDTTMPGEDWDCKYTIIIYFLQGLM